MSVYFCTHLFLHSLCVLNANLSDNVLYLDTFTYKLEKNKIATKIFRKKHIFYSLSHMNAQFVVSAKFLIDNFFLVPLERNDLHLQDIRRFYVLSVTISLLLNMLTIILCICGNIVD